MLHKGDMKLASDLQIFAVQFSSSVNIFKLYFFSISYSAALFLAVCYSLKTQRPCVENTSK